MERANLSYADVTGGDLRNANLTNAILQRTNLEEALLDGAVLNGADLTGADLSRASLRGTDLSGVNLTAARLVETDLSEANISGCRVYGISSWNVNCYKTRQYNLVISKVGEPLITVDDLELAQFIYLLLNNQKIRHVIDTITSKVVLILGRFTPERKAILDAIRDELRKRDYLPVLFDFEKPANRDITETVSTLAHMARFVIADITDAKSIPQELMAIVPTLPSVPVQPLLLARSESTACSSTSSDFRGCWSRSCTKIRWALLPAIAEKVIDPAEALIREQIRR